MANELRLKRPGKLTMRINTIVLAVIILASIAVGFAASKFVSFDVAKENCIPQEDFDYFLGQANTLQADYQKCVSDLWALQFSYKQQSIAKTNLNTNLTNSS